MYCHGINVNLKGEIYLTMVDRFVFEFSGFLPQYYSNVTTEGVLPQIENKQLVCQNDHLPVFFQ